VYDPSKIMARSVLSSSAIGDIRRITGKQYPTLEAAFDALGPNEQRELVMLLHDVDGAIRQAARRAAMQPWRRT
jgi:hypothetical protein